MPFLIDDHLETLEMSEENGVIRSMTLYGIIADIPSVNDYRVLLEAYKQVGLITPGTFLVDPADPLNPDPVTPPGKEKGAAMLLLARRQFKVVDKDKKHVGVTMFFQHFMEGDNQCLTPQAMSPNGWKVPYSSTVYGKNRASVQQTKSNYYDTQVSFPSWNSHGIYPIGEIVEYRGFYWQALQNQIWTGPLDPDLVPPPGPTGTLIGTIWRIVDETTLVPSLPAPVRRQIVVGHQFPGSDPDSPKQIKYQTGEITFMQPNDNFKLHGQVFIRNPRAIKIAVLGAINSVPWMDGAPYTWMCTEVSWEPMYVSWQWRMTFEFQHNEDTWLPTAIFHDARHGRPPANLIDGFGYRRIHKHKELNFENYFRVTFGCAPNAGA